MRILEIALISAAMAASLGVANAINTKADDASALVLHSTLGSVTGANAPVIDPVREVKSGETVTITGECVTEATSADELRVVLTLADRDTARPGYHALLATDQEIRSGNLNVRVPDLPDAESRVFLVRVFQLGEKSPQICDAGSIRVGAGSQEKLG